MQIITIIWLIGIAVAWFQIKYWYRHYALEYPYDYVILAFLSMLSWLIYPIYVFNWLHDKINK